MYLALRNSLEPDIIYRYEKGLLSYVARVTLKRHEDIISIRNMRRTFGKYSGRLLRRQRREAEASIQRIFDDELFKLLIK